MIIPARDSNIAEEAEKQRKEEAIMSKKIKAREFTRTFYIPFQIL